MATFLRHSLTAIHRVDALIYLSIIVFLVSYVSIDTYIRTSTTTTELDTSLCESLSAEAVALREAKLTGEDAQALVNKWTFQEDKHCGSIVGHLPAKNIYSLPQDHQKVRDAWHQMKWVGKPAVCRVKGHQIEALDDVHNFRRGYALKYTWDVEDKTHILPWLLGNRVDLNLRKRRVLLDLGGNMFNTSIQWFMRMYPCDFTEVHVFEIDTKLFQFPSSPYEESSNVAEPNMLAVTVNETPHIPSWMIQRMKLYNVFVSDADDVERNMINITRFIKEELRLTAEDAVVVKMDIEGSEWDILHRWTQDPDMAAIVDELFVEIHYSDFSMGGFGWFQFEEHTREQAVHLLAGLRAKGFFAHAWP